MLGSKIGSKTGICSLLRRQASFAFSTSQCVNSTVEMPPCKFEYEAKRKYDYDEVHGIRDKYLAHQVVYYSKPLLITQGRMQWLWDNTGRRYLDLFGGIVTVSVGHCHPKVNARAKEQIDTLWHTTSIYRTPPIHEYAKKLAAEMPGNLKVCMFTNSGSEANEMAIMMARLYTGAYDILSLRNGYHGASQYTVGLTAQSSWKFNLAGGFGMHHAMNPDPYVGLWGGSHCRDCIVQTTRTCGCLPDECEAKHLYIDRLQETIDYSCGPKIAAFFAESIQGVGGTVQYPKGYIKDAFALIRSKGGLCVADEVQTGFGRTGTHMWGFEGHDVIPDIVTMAKGMGNGIPLGAVVTTPEIAAVMKNALHFNTYSGNPISCAIGSAVLDVIKEENLRENCLNMGNYFLEELAKVQEQYEHIGDVRGKGLMIGVELVEDKKSRKPISTEKMGKFFENLKEMGVLTGKGGYYGNVLRIKPPMCINKDDIDFGIHVMKKALQNLN